MRNKLDADAGRLTAIQVGKEVKYAVVLPTPNTSIGSGGLQRHKYTVNGYVANDPHVGGDPLLRPIVTATTESSRVK
jgi:hypothetical protein